MPGLAFPPFPEDIPTHPLHIVDYELIHAGDTSEVDKLWKAATELGFWYLKNHGAHIEVESMFEMGAETTDFSLVEKMRFEQANNVNSFGYKAIGTLATIEDGDPDNVEFIDVSKEDALAYPEVIHSAYPSTVNARMGSTVTPFVNKSLDVIETTLSIFERKLDLPHGALLNLHTNTGSSGCQARCIKSPPRLGMYNDTETTDKNMVALGAHTDFGSLSFVHNRLGGLQVLPPNSPDWQYVHPLPGHAICNVGDALTIFSGGILRSNLHRIVPSPGTQAAYDRSSVGYFSRPNHDVYLHALEETEAIRGAVACMSPNERARYQPNVTQGEWYARRMYNERIKNRTGPETWHANRSIEYRPDFI